MALNTAGLNGAIVNSLVISGSNIYAGANAFAGNGNGGVFLSTDNGTTWTSVNTGFPNQTSVAQSERQTDISVSNCDGIEVSFNNINRNYPALGTNLEQSSNLGIWVTESKGANIFQNYMTHMGSGIYTNGLLTNTRFSCNTLDDNYFGFQFGFNSSVSHQGT